MSKELQLLQIFKEILKQPPRIDRTMVGTKAIFGIDLRFDCSQTFPLGTTRPVSLRLVFEELMWILRGQTDVKKLQEKGVHVWDFNSSREFLDKNNGQHLEEGDLGGVYGFPMRYYGATYKTCKDDYTGQGVDQLAYVINLLKTNPTSRRILINLWNPAALNQVPLPPCGFCYQFFVSNNGDGAVATLGGSATPTLSLKVTQRSSDIALAGLWNIASGALFLRLMARVCKFSPGELIWSVGDAHIYLNQEKAVQEQLVRVPYEFPTLYFTEDAPTENILDFEWRHLILHNYQHHPRIKFPLN